MTGDAAKIVQRVFASEAIAISQAGPAVDIYTRMADRIVKRVTDGPPLLVGLCGAQGSGKSTAAIVLQELLDNAGLATVRLSLDDLYLTLEDRRQLADTIHPLLITRGVPGTHDIPLGLALLSRLLNATSASSTPIPVFDKALDNRVPEAEWSIFKGAPKVILFEGWCVGARPQAGFSLLDAVNSLERQADADGIWRHYVNEQLGGPYQRLFEEIDMLILLQAPGFDHVLAWRKEQESNLRAFKDISRARWRHGNIMDDQQLYRFIQHYERLTRYILHEMPARADVIIKSSSKRLPEHICFACHQLY